MNNVAALTFNKLSYSIIKRLMDLLFVASVFLLLWWAMLIIWACIRFQTPGPGIFSQQRVGKDGALFYCYKFRTMFTGTANVGTHDVSQSSITPIGAFLRKTKLDELPQAWNILLNQMSLVGPRPCLPVQVTLIEERRRRGVLGNKPGISGLAQINNIDMSEPERLAKWDEKYIRTQSISLDFKIILATAFGSGQGDKTK